MTTLKRNVRTFSDLDLMFQINPISKDVAKRTNDAAVKQAIRLLVLTMNYERPFHPELGSPIYGLLFEPATPITAEVIRTAVIQLIENFEPRAKLMAVDVVASPDYNSYRVSITFGMANYTEPFQVSVLLKKLR